MIVEYKAYLDAKDIQSVIDCSRTIAYSIINELRKQPYKNGLSFEDSYEAKLRRKKVIPTDLFIKNFPSTKKCFKRG